MPNIKEIRSSIESVNATCQITNAMKMVAAAKLSKRQGQLTHFSTYMQQVVSLLQGVVASTGVAPMESYMQQRPLQKVLLVIVSSDKGLCGSFNANVIKKALEAIQQFPDLTADCIDLLIIGKKALSSFQKRAHKIIDTYHMVGSTLNYLDITQAGRYIVDAFISQQYDHVGLVYNLWQGVASQEATIEPFLPFSLPRTMGSEWLPHYICEPSALFLAKRLVPKYLVSKLYNVILGSQVAENGSRMATMSKATDNAKNLLKTLHISYNKTRQAAITNEILEIAAGAESLK